jgi:hypothetical protein
VKNLDTEQRSSRIAELENELKKAKRKKANVFGATGKKEKERGTWCTPKNWAEAVGPWDLDPF